MTIDSTPGRKSVASLQMCDKPRVVFISGREVGYMRNRVLIEALRIHLDVTVLTFDVHTTVGRIIASLACFITHRLDYDVCFAGFYGQPISIALSVLQRKPIILDAYISTYDTLCDERRWFPPQSLMGRLAHWLDHCSCRVATRVITDTQAHALYFKETFGIPQSKLVPVYVGCDETLFYPRDETSADAQRFEVFYYGAFLPLHGTEVIVEAAALLRDRPDIQFILGGDGAGRSAVQQMITDLALTNIELVGWIELERLPEYIARASICLGGHFSNVPKASRVVSTKTFQFIAMRKPTIVGDNPATRELFISGEHVYAVPMGDPVALAEAIRILANNIALRRRIAWGGYDIFQQQLTLQAIADHLVPVVEDAWRETTLLD